MTTTISDDKKPKRTALGKGLNALLGITADETPELSPENYLEVPSVATVVEIPIEKIEPNPQQPRKIFDDKELESLANSLKIDGVLQPITVTKSQSPGRFYIIAGERRWRASKLAGLRTIPAIIKQSSSQDMLRLALIENIQREDLNAIEEAEAYQALIGDYGLTQEQCAENVGKDRATVANTLRLLSLPKEIQDDLVENRLTMGHGRALLSLDDKKLILRAKDMIIKKQLNVRQTEELCKSIKKIGAQREDQPLDDKDCADLDYLAENLRSHLKTKVRVYGSGSRGKIEISYFSSAELERIMTLLGVDFS